MNITDLQVLDKLPVEISHFTKMVVVFSYASETSPDRRIIYALSYKEKLLYVPTALTLAKLPDEKVCWFNCIQPLLPVWVYGNWAESKCDGTKFKICLGELDLHAVLPSHYWR